METRSPLSYFFNGDKTKVLKIILSPCLVNISDGDKIPIVIFFNGDKTKVLKIILSPFYINISDGDKIPIAIFLMETRLSLFFLQINMRIWSLYLFFLFRKILSLYFVNNKMEIMSLSYYLLKRGIISPETISPSDMGTRNHELYFF